MKDIDENSTEALAGKRRHRRGLTIPWPALTLVLLVVTLASIGALVIVATVSRADSLATVALVLAILAFGAQLIVTAAQTASANEQYRQVNRLYEDTRAVLTRIRSQSKMLLSNQSDQFNKILDHVLSPSAIQSAVAEARGDNDEDVDTEQGPTPTAKDVTEISKLLRAEADRALVDERAKRVARKVARRPDRSELTSFPTEEEASDVLDRFLSLSDDAKEHIRASAERHLKTPDSPFVVGKMLQDEITALPPYFKELEDAGLVLLEPFRRDGKTTTGRTLTDQGLVAVRFFTGRGRVPEYLKKLFVNADRKEDRP